MGQRAGVEDGELGDVQKDKELGGKLGFWRRKKARKFGLWAADWRLRFCAKLVVGWHDMGGFARFAVLGALGSRQWSFYAGGRARANGSKCLLAGLVSIFSLCLLMARLWAG